MEPELEELAGTWSPAKRLETARKLKQWERQLRVSAFIILSERCPVARRGLRALPLQKASLN